MSDLFLLLLLLLLTAISVLIPKLQQPALQLFAVFFIIFAILYKSLA